MHYEDGADVEAAQRAWAEKMSCGEDRGRVVEGRKPQMGCFCNRPDCMFELVKQWREETGEGEGKLPGRNSSTTMWRDATTVPGGRAQAKPGQAPSIRVKSEGGGQGGCCAGTNREQSAGASGGTCRGNGGIEGGERGVDVRGGSRGEFPGSVHDVWVCPYCDARNRSWQRVCSQCGKLAGWAEDMPGVNVEQCRNLMCVVQTAV